jgi:four helix bundle protein
LVIDCGIDCALRGEVGDKAEHLKTRAKEFALNTMRFVDRLPTDAASRYLGQQLLRSANAVAANYRAACRARSRAEFVSRMGVVAEEADESAHWLDLLSLRGAGPAAERGGLVNEAHELEAIFSASYGTSKRRLAAARR